VNHPRAARPARCIIVVVAAAIVVHDLAGGASVTTSVTNDAAHRAFAAARLILVAIAGLITIQRGTPKRDALLFGGLIGLALEIFWEFVPPGAWFWPAVVLANVAIGAGVVQLVRFAVDCHPDPRVRRYVTLAAIVCGCALTTAGLALIALAFGTFGGVPLDSATFDAIAPWIDRVRWTALLAAMLGMLASSVASLRAAEPAARNRAATIAIGFAPMVAASSVHALVHVVRARDFDWAMAADAAGYAATAAILAYATLRRRLIDIEYAVSTAIAGGLGLTGVALSAYAAEHFGVPLLERTMEGLPFLERFGEQIRALAGLGGGFLGFLAVGRFHERMNERVRGALFHERDERIATIERFAAKTLWSLDGAVLPERVLEAAKEGAGATSACLYLRAGRAFRLQCCAGSDAPASVSPRDPSVPEMREPRRSPDGGLTLPMPVSGRLYGFIRVVREGDVAFAPDETDALALLAREAGNAMASSRARPPRKAAGARLHEGPG
jgi:hypothetical protein